jgi:hypothetical protein
VTIPDPTPGTVIRYEFLWSRERAAGNLDAAKSRPCAVVLAIPRGESGALQTVVAPITHSPPAEPDSSIEISAAVCRSLGLDDGRHWIRIDELNSFAWPGIDLRPIPGKPGEYIYGMLPRKLFERIRQGILDRQKSRKGTIVSRSSS